MIGFILMTVVASLAVWQIHVRDKKIKAMLEDLASLAGIATELLEDIVKLADENDVDLTEWADSYKPCECGQCEANNE